MCVCVYVYIYIHIYTHTYTHLSIHCLQLSLFLRVTQCPLHAHAIINIGILLVHR